MVSTFPHLSNERSFIDKLNKEYSKNKSIPKSFKKQILLALAHFPELKSIKIDFEVQAARFPLQAHPDIWGLLIPGKERRYTIIISNSSVKEFEDILLDKIPFDGQVGVIGHELAHVSYYLDKNSLELIEVGLKYLFSSTYRGYLERLTDDITIGHGLGFQLLSWRNYYEGLPLSQNKEEKSIYFEDRYLSAKEIKRKIKAIKN